MTPRLRAWFITSAVAALSVTLASATGAAQEVGARRGGTGVTSPEVAQDRRVTFRLRAPEAKAVTVSGDFGPDAEMRKRRRRHLERDRRSARSGDVRLLLHRRRRPAHRSEQPAGEDRLRHHDHDQPADGARHAPAFYDVQDVPHGEIRTLLYRSTSNGVTRELNVYVPPGYEQARNRRYPVLYLLHGFANDHHSWHRYGRANDILDNLLANGLDRAVPRGHAARLRRRPRQRRRDRHRARRLGRVPRRSGALRARPARGHHPDDRRQVPDDRRPEAPGDRRLLDGRRTGGALRPAPPRDVQHRRHHERRHGRRRNAAARAPIRWLRWQPTRPRRTSRSICCGSRAARTTRR